MSEISERYRRIAAEFTRRVDVVPDEAWDNPTPCAGWVARDVVGHLTAWLPGFFFGTWDIAAGPIVPVADDPVRAWHAVDDAIQSALDNPEIAKGMRNTPMGEATFEDTIDQICTPDVLVHTWDLARATGLDDTLDAEEVHRFVGGMEAADTAMRASGHYGPRIEVPADADEQTRLIAFVGRQP